MTRICVVEARSMAPQAWRNGGGQTRELLAWPSTADWCLRISRADITEDGPFSAFAGVQRWFAVLEGGGVQLALANGLHTLLRGDAPLGFDGAEAPGCALVDGATQDLNLMLRSGKGGMWAVRAGQGWQQPFAMRGLYTAAPGFWSSGEDQHKLPAHSLLWAEDADDGAWHFQADTTHSGTPAFWLGFSPQG